MRTKIAASYTLNSTTTISVKHYKRQGGKTTETEEVKFRFHESIEEAEEKKTEGLNVEILTTEEHDTDANDISGMRS